MLDSHYLSIATEAMKILQQEEISDITHFILKNPLKWEPEKLRIFADQWNFKKKAKEKLGPWHAQYPLLLGPPKISWEQSSSHWTALWKASLFQPGEQVVDMTGGWGMDSLFFAHVGAQVTHCELNAVLGDLVTYNASQLGLKISTFTGSCFDFLEASDQTYDALYFDPARRDAQQKKVVRLADLTPDLTPHWTKLTQRAHRLVIKLSPMMDLNEITDQIPNIQSVTLLSVRNELKEIVVESCRQTSGSIQWKTIDFPTEGPPVTYTYYPEKEDPDVTSYSEPRQYVYEPLVGILKLGAFHQIATDWQLEKLHPNTHLYTSDSYKPDFPGRIFEVKSSFRPKAEVVFKSLGKPIPANLLVRNYGENGEDLAKKWQLKAKDTTQFLIFTQTIVHKKAVFYAHRLK